MTITRRIAFGMALLFAGVCLADASNILVSFSTQGPDRYADGQTVLDNEWYALVWSADGDFNGFTPSAGPIDPNDRVVLMAPLAKDGKCPFVVFQVAAGSADYKTTGKYAVYMLDTRNAAKTAPAASQDGKPALVNGALASAAYTAGAATSGIASSDVSSAAWAASDLAAGEDRKLPTITSFRIDGAKVSIEVSDLTPGFKYNVATGADPEKLETYALDVPVMSDDTATFNIDRGDAKFFQVTRQPITK